MDPDQRIYVGNLAYCLDANQIKKIFRNIGTVVEVVVPPSKNENSGHINRGYAFVTFAQTTEAAMAIEIMHKTLDPFYNRELVVKKALPKGTTHTHEKA